MKLYYFEGIDELKEYPDGIIQMRATKVKPFPTCQTCPFYSQCSIRRNENQQAPPMQFCSQHPDFEGVK